MANVTLHFFKLMSETAFAISRIIGSMIRAVVYKWLKNSSNMEMVKS